VENRRADEVFLDKDVVLCQKLMRTGFGRRRPFAGVEEAFFFISWRDYARRHNRLGEFIRSRLLLCGGYAGRYDWREEDRAGGDG
jgi:hypothetical protein